MVVLHTKEVRNNTKKLLCLRRKWVLFWEKVVLHTKEVRNNTKKSLCLRRKWV